MEVIEQRFNWTMWMLGHGWLITSQQYGILWFIYAPVSHMAPRWYAGVVLVGTFGFGTWRSNIEETYRGRATAMSGPLNSRWNLGMDEKLHYKEANGIGLIIHVSVSYVPPLIWQCMVVMAGRLNIKMSSYQYRDPHVKDKTVSRPSYL